MSKVYRFESKNNRIYLLKESVPNTTKTFKEVDNLMFLKILQYLTKTLFAVVTKCVI